ncbi:MAG: hypothetical protein ACOVOC_03345 [Rhabdaerophilum sp.]
MTRAIFVSLRRVLAVLACLLLLLGGVAQQRAFASKLGMPGSGAMALCLPGMAAPDGATLPSAPLHDCFECCLGTLPGLAGQAVSHVEAPSLPAQGIVLPDRKLRPAGMAALPCSRGPPGRA